MGRGLSVVGIVSFLILGFVFLSLAVEVIPQITALEPEAVTENSTAGAQLIHTTLDISRWLVPAAAVVALVLACVAWLKSKMD